MCLLTGLLTGCNEDDKGEGSTNYFMLYVENQPYPYKLDLTDELKNVIEYHLKSSEKITGNEEVDRFSYDILLGDKRYFYIEDGVLSNTTPRIIYRNKVFTDIFLYLKQKHKKKKEAEATLIKIIKSVEDTKID